MKQLDITLFIARSSESADLYLSSHGGAIKTHILGSLLSSEVSSTSVAMDPLIGKIVLQRAIQSLLLDHFDYLSQAESSIGELYAHILSCKRNKVGFEEFGYDPKKLSELVRIHKAYEELKTSMELKDSADVLLEAIATLKETRYFDQYTSVIIDTFEDEGIRFYANECEREALEILRALAHAEVVKSNTEISHPISTFTPMQSRFDEAIFAIKAARKLMKEGVSDTDIAIVTGNLGNYRRVLEGNAEQYGMKLRFSSGTPLLQSPIFQRYFTAKTFEEFKAAFSEQLKKDIETGIVTYQTVDSIKQTFTQIQKLHQRCMKHSDEVQKLFGVKSDFKETVLKLAEETYIPPLKEDAGIWVSEPNQMTQRSFKHIIFIGTDLSQFPPKAKGNFLSTPSQREEYLGVDNSYRLSQYYFDKLRKNSEHLHISVALQEGKKKLFISPIITDLPDKSFEEYECVSVREELLSFKRYIQDNAFEEYVDSMLSSQITGFDGMATAHQFQSGILSASSLNEYAKCPLRYLLSYNYKSEPLAMERDDDALEASDIGIIFHSIAETFANDVKSRTVALTDKPNLAIKEHLQSIAIKVHHDYIQKEIIDNGKTPNIFHEIVLHDLLKGLFEEHHERGLLVRLLDYVYESGKLEHFEKSEQRFMLDENFTITTDKEAAILKGFIDRIDCDRHEKALTVIDYKTGKYAKAKETRLLEEMGAFKQFQLPLYLLYASQAYADYTIDSYLLAMRDGKGTKAYAHMSTDEANGLLFDAAYAQNLKQTIKQIKCDIEEGRFGMSPSESNCEYCPHERICHKDILPHKCAIEENEGRNDE